MESTDCLSARAQTPTASTVIFVQLYVPCPQPVPLKKNQFSNINTVT